MERLEAFSKINLMKIIGVTPAGRARYLRVLAPYLLKNQHVLQEHRFWVNTDFDEDRDYILQLCAEYPHFFKAEFLPDDEPDGIFTIHKFFENCCDRDAIYVRLDDDICWVAEDAIEKLVQARIQDRHPFLIYGNTINHPICSRRHQQKGALSFEKGEASGEGLCDIAWRSGEFAELAHRSFLKACAEGKESRFHIEDVIVPAGARQRVAINFIAWLGEDMAACQGKVGEKEEDWLSIERPDELKRPLKIIGDAMVAHFAYFPQRKHMDQTGILEQYQVLSGVS